MSVNSESRKLVLVAIENEKPEHLGLKLAAYLLFWKENLTVDPSLKSSALAGQPFRPDLLGTDITGSTAAWVECGNTTEHKIGKVLRRWPAARIAVVKEYQRVAEDFRRMLSAKVPKSERVEVYYWPEGGFKEWMECLSEKTEIIGEANDAGFNLVVNERVYLADIRKC